VECSEKEKEVAGVAAGVETSLYSVEINQWVGCYR